MPVDPYTEEKLSIKSNKTILKAECSTLMATLWKMLLQVNSFTPLTGSKINYWVDDCAFKNLLTRTAAARWFHESAGLIVTGNSPQSYALATLLGVSVGPCSHLRLGCTSSDNAVGPISVGLGAECLAGARLCFDLRINFCILAFVSLSASPCSNHRNLFVSLTSATFDNNTSYYLYLHELNTLEPRQSEC